VVSTGDDTLIHYWNRWWVKKALSEGHEIQLSNPPLNDPVLFSENDLPVKTDPTREQKTRFYLD